MMNGEGRMGQAAQADADRSRVPWASGLLDQMEREHIMDKVKNRKKYDSKKQNMLSELNSSLYTLAAYLSEYVSALREATAKPALR
jgi:hypothetical protein